MAHEEYNTIDEWLSAVSGAEPWNDRDDVVHFMKDEDRARFEQIFSQWSDDQKAENLRRVRDEGAEALEALLGTTILKDRAETEAERRRNWRDQHDRYHKIGKYAPKMSPPPKAKNFRERAMEQMTLQQYFDEIQRYAYDVIDPDTDAPRGMTDEQRAEFEKEFDAWDGVRRESIIQALSRSDAKDFTTMMEVIKRKQ